MMGPTVQLGNSGIQVPRLMIGAEVLGGHDWGDLDIQEVQRATAAAIESGLTFIDVADCYGLGLAEERLGTLVKSKRDEVVIATKFGVRFHNGKTFYDNSPEYMQQALEGSLRRLGSDYIDLYQVHWPDGKTPLCSVLEALEDARTAGKIRTYGVSNTSLLQTLPEKAPEHLASFSMEYSLANRAYETEIRSTCENWPLSFLSWGTLGQGVLSGKYNERSAFARNDRRSKPQWKNFRSDALHKNLQIVETMRTVARELEDGTVPLTALAIAWNLHALPGSIAIVGAKTLEQVTQNARALQMDLPAWAVERLDNASALAAPMAATG